MAVETARDLIAKRCKPCEGGVAPVPAEEAREQASRLEGWTVTEDGKRLRKRWKMKHFLAAVEFFRRIAELAESEQHHPDLHLTGYREVAVEITTHAVGGLSENDFILAAKIDRLPCEGSQRVN